jgi:hypothetical protein
MRCNLFLVLSLVTAAAVAQNPKTPGLYIPSTTAPAGAVSQAATPPQTAVPTQPPQTAQPAQTTQPSAQAPVVQRSTSSVTTLGEMSKAGQPDLQKPVVPATDPQAIVVLDGNGKPMDEVAAKLMSKQKAASEIRLHRLSYIDGEKRAILIVSGVSRFVRVGAKVQTSYVSEIRDEGVCLDSSVSSQKCAKFITFTGIRE